ncbi:MAG: hypothetical protein ACD_75C02465G0001 [uncultured bacterium]|nr:MAG: hypothetical protein ACD_75C02465G0001 [uncultured bacterium]
MIEDIVGPFHPLPQGLVSLQFGHADAYPQLGDVVGPDIKFIDGNAQPLGQNPAVVKIGVVEDQEEFIATHPHQEIGRTNGFFQHRRNSLQHLITLLVTEIIINVLESVQIHGNHR